MRRELVPLFLSLLGWKKRRTEEAVSWFDSDVSTNLILGFDLPRAERRTRIGNNWNCLILPMSWAYQHGLLKRVKTNGTSRGGYCHLIKLISCPNLSCTSQRFDNTTEYFVQAKFTKVGLSPLERGRVWPAGHLQGSGLSEQRVWGSALHFCDISLLKIQSPQG